MEAVGAVYIYVFGADARAASSSGHCLLLFRLNISHCARSCPLYEY